jgi:hypothetical protein
VRSAILIFLASLAFATTPARAQSAWLERDMVRAVCSREAAPAAGERLASRLNLTDVQKSALKDMTDAFASANALQRSRYAPTSRIFLRRRVEWRSPKGWRRSRLPA